MTIPAGVIIAWPGTAATIPSGWTRVTSLDGKFAKGASGTSNPDTTGGSSTHTHGSTSHSHTIASHTHTGQVSTNLTGIGGGPGLYVGNHSHSVSASDSASSSLAGQSPTWSSQSLIPSYYDVIWIQSDGTPAGIPSGAIVFWNESSTPTGFTQHNASKNRQLRGAAANGNGGSTGGSAAGGHTHTSSHSHSFDAHSHGSKASSIATLLSTDSAGIRGAFGSFAWLLREGHNHLATFGAITSGATSGTHNATTGSHTADIPYHSLAAISANTNDVLATGMICAWLGLISAIPSGWSLCDGTSSTPDLRGRFVRAANAFANVGDTGGSSSHTHTSSSHNHDATHSHAITFSTTGVAATTDTTWAIPSAGRYLFGNHGHYATSSTSSGNSGSATQSVVSVDHEPEHRTVAWIQFKASLQVTITSPTNAQNVSDSSPTVTWTFVGGGTQNTYRVHVYSDSAQNSEIYDSGTVSSATQSHTIPLGRLLNQQTYYLRVTANATQSGSALSGISAQRTFNTAWTPPSALAAATVSTNVTISALAGFAITWAKAVPATNQTFIAYQVHKRRVGEAESIVIYQTTDINTLTYTDYNIAWDQGYEFRVGWIATIGGSQVLSALPQFTSATASPRNRNATLHVVNKPSVHAELLQQSVRVQESLDIEFLHAWARQSPTAHVSNKQFATIQINAKEFWNSNREMWDNLVKVLTEQRLSGSVLCLRHREELYYVAMSSVNRNDSLPVIYDAAIALREVHYNEDVSE